jgi:hypothetical protein
MPSSISNSDDVGVAQGRADTPPPDRAGAQRKTASDRPGVAQPVPERDVPLRPWRRISVAMLVMLALLLSGWEWYWRAFGVTPTLRNDEGLWAIQRRRIDQGEGDATVLVGSSRILFDVQLQVWEKLGGKRPIQLALEGTSSLPMLEDLADDPHFTGRLLIGIAPQLFFPGYAAHGMAFLRYYRKESPSQRSGQWLSMHLIEPFVAFDDPDFALMTVLRRQAWPARPGNHWFSEIRKLMDVADADRNSHMWSKVVDDPEYRALMRSIWAEEFVHYDDDPTPEKSQEATTKQIDRTVAAVAKLRARGVKVLFVRAPSNGPFLEYEDKQWPREKTWDVLLAKTGAPGIHFKDYSQLQGFDQPEWSHLSEADAQRFTEALYGIVEKDFWGSDLKRQVGTTE